MTVSVHTTGKPLLSLKEGEAFLVSHFSKHEIQIWHAPTDSTDNRKVFLLSKGSLIKVWLVDRHLSFLTFPAHRGPLRSE